MQPTSRPTHVRAYQSGMVLIVALVMLVVIGLASVAIMRNAFTTDLISENNRWQAQALQAAQAGLRFCENEARANPPTLTPTAAAATIDAEDWKTFANWKKGASMLQEVSAAYVTNSSSGPQRVANRPLPQCMAQYRSLPNTGATTQTLVVTARGFSDNYAQDGAGHTQTGAVVWLQSIIQF